MSERPATRADLRASAWRVILNGPRGPGHANGHLSVLWGLDAEEAGDAAAARYVAVLLGSSFVETSPDGRFLRVRWRKPEPVP